MPWHLWRVISRDRTFIYRRFAEPWDFPYVVWRHVGEAPCICTPEVNMAAEEENIDMEDETPKEKGKKAAKHDSGAADLEKVTDYVEETEISSQNMADVSTWSLNVDIIAQSSHLSKQETWPRD